MNTQPETYRCDYGRGRNLLPVAILLLAFLAFAWHLDGQESDSTLDPGTLGLIQQGEDAFKAGHYDKAEAAFRKANKLQHDACYACWVGIAQTREFMKDYAGALKASEKALKAATNDEQRASAHELRGEILRVEVTGEAHSAMFEHQVSGGYVELRPSAGQVEKASAKPLAAAEQEFRAAVALAQDNATYHLALARILFLESRDDEAKQEAQRYLQLAPDGHDSKWARDAIENPRRARERFAPDFEVTTRSGDTVSLSSLRGKFVVLDFWATWCSPCRESVGELKDLTRKYSKDDVVLLSVSADFDGKEWRSYIAQRKMDWAQYWDEDTTIRRLFDVHVFPTYIIIDRDGVIRDRIMGMNDKESVVHRLKQTLQTLTPEKGS